MIPQTLREQLVRDEGLRLKVYNDSRGIPTIGIGRNLRDKGISQAEAELMLDNDILEYTAAVVARVPWCHTLDPVRFEVLVNMAFNLGIGGLLEFTKTLALLERQDYGEAAREMLRSKWAEQVGLRAERLARQIATGERQ